MNKIKLNSFGKRIISGILFLLIFLPVFIFFPGYFSLLILIMLFEILILEWKNFFEINSPMFWLLMPFYPALPFIFIILLNDQIYRKLLLIIFILVFCFDSGSYIAGKLFGKHKICPSISPGKTWEGFIGGFLFTIISLVLILLYFNKSINILFLTGFTTIVSILALTGDLFESSLKRKAGIKDSGNIMPGHGGLLDRFDGIMFVTVFVYFFRNYLINILS